MINPESPQPDPTISRLNSHVNDIKRLYNQSINTSATAIEGWHPFFSEQTNSTQTTVSPGAIDPSLKIDKIEWQDKDGEQRLGYQIRGFGELPGVPQHAQVEDEWVVKIKLTPDYKYVEQYQAQGKIREGTDTAPLEFELIKQLMTQIAQASNS